MGTDDELGTATLIELHRAVAVGAVCGYSAERRERLGCGMTIPVLCADGDDRRARPNSVDEWHGVRACGAVMRGNVHARGERPWAQKKVGLGLFGRVPHEQHREGATLEAQHERRDVNTRIAIRCEDREGRVADSDPHTRGDGAPRYVCPRDTVAPRRGDGAGVQADGFDRDTNLVSLEHADEAVGVIGMRVRQRDDVDPAIPRGKARPQLGKESRRVGAAVDEKGSAVEFDEERVALPDIERTHAYAGRRRP